MQILQAQRAALSWEIHRQVRHAVRHVGSRSTKDRVLRHGIGALECDHGGESLRWRPSRFAEVAFQRFAVEGDFHALERRADHLTGFVERLPHFSIRWQHAPIIFRQRPGGVSVEVLRPPVVLTRRHLQALGGIPVGEFFVLLGHARPFRVPRIGIVRPHALSHVQLVGIARVHGLHQPDLELASARQSFSRKKHRVVPAADHAALAGRRTEILRTYGDGEHASQCGSARRGKSHFIRRLRLRSDNGAIIRPRLPWSTLQN